MSNKYDKNSLPFGNAAAILDPDTISVLGNFVTLQDTLLDTNVHNVFTEKYLEWIISGKNNTFKGLDNFPFKCFTNGTTEGFEKFYMKNSNKRFRCFRGEYLYHRLTWRNNWPNWKHLEDEPLKVGDAVVISLPFSDTGNKHPLLEQLLSECDELKIPVLLDCAYFGICAGIEFNLEHSCITDVTFSLSKTFPVAHMRIGMRLTRTDDDDPLFVVNKSGYINRVSAGVGIEFISRFSPDFIFNQYRQQQIAFCKHLEVMPSQSVMFGIADNKWNEYNRDGPSNRLSFHRQMLDPVDFFKKYEKR